MSAKITALAELTTIAVGDWIPVVDVSDTSMAPTGTDKRISPPNLHSGLTITATTGTFTLAAGKTFTSSNTLTLAGTDGSTLNIGAGGTLGTSAFITLGANVGTALAVAVGSAGAFVTFNGAGGTPSSMTGTNITGIPVAGLSNLGSGVGSWLIAPSSFNLAAAVTDETGSGALVFGTSPSFTTSVVSASTTLAVFNTVATTVNAFGAATTLNMGNASGTNNVLGITALNGATASSSTTLIVPASTTAVSPLRIPHGTAPTSPVNGDIWTTTSGVVARINGSTVTLGSGGSGDVVGPGSATDNAIVRFDSTTGKLIQDSAVTIADTTGNISTPGSVSAGVGGSVAGTMELAQGTAPSTGTTSAKVYVPTSVTSYTLRLFAAAPTSGVVLATTTSTDTVLSTSATLAVANGGTGLASGTSGGVLAYTASGTLASSGALAANAIVIGGGAGVAPSTTTTGTGVLTLLGVAANGSASDGPGYRGAPQNSQSAAYTTVMADNGKCIFHPVGDNNARTFTIDSNANVAYPIGAIIEFINMAAANVTIAITSDTMTLLPAGTTGSRTLAQYGRASAEKITSTSWIISGNSALT